MESFSLSNLSKQKNLSPQSCKRSNPNNSILTIKDQYTTPKHVIFLLIPHKAPYSLIPHPENDNLRNEYTTLFTSVPPSIPFARIALQRPPEAINFWLGNSYSVTALHKDPYENIYVQVLGRKHFVLLPPVEAACVGETVLEAATYAPKDKKDGNEVGELDLEVNVDEPAATVPFATWDPDVPLQRATAFSHLSQPLRVTLDPGDMLYLPALWYHKVSQSCSEEGICCAINYW
jgi:jumonji domain-containing protein 7